MATEPELLFIKPQWEPEETQYRVWVGNFYPQKTHDVLGILYAVVGEQVCRFLSQIRWYIMWVVFRVKW